MKRFVYIAALSVWLVIMMLSSPFDGGVMAIDETAENSKTIFYFYGQGCPHCANVDQYFTDNNYYETYPIEKKEVYFNRQNSQLFNETMSNLGIPVSDRVVPTLVIGQVVISGDSPIIEKFRVEADAYLAGNQVIAQPSSEAISENQSQENKVTIPLIVGASLVDAINPCAFAVLIILLSTVLAKKDRKQALRSGLCFSTSIFISYILMGLGVYAALGSLGSTNVITSVVGVFAIILGLMNLKDYFWYGKAFLVEVPRAWRPNMRKLIGTVTSPFGAFLIGFLVSLFLLPCTSGPYLVVLGLLAENPFDITAMSYLILYNIIFVSPMIAITLLVYKGGDIDKIEYFRQANLERLHLIAGLILVGLGIFILL